MITRQKFSPDFKKTIGLELASGLSTAGRISKREGISANTIYKWRDMLADYTLTSSETELNDFKRNIKDLEEIINDQAIQIHILKKTQKIMEELKKRERLSGSILPRSLESK